MIKIFVYYLYIKYISYIISFSGLIQKFWISLITIMIMSY